MDVAAFLSAVRQNDPRAASLVVPAAVPPSALASALSLNTVAVQLVLAGHRHYTPGDVCAVLAGVSNNTSLRVLDLSDMGLAAAAVPHVADFVKHAPSLERLLLSGNALGPAHMAALGAACALHPSLQVLALDSCCLGSGGVAALLSALPAAECTLHRLDLGHNALSTAKSDAADPSSVGPRELLEDYAASSQALVKMNVNGNFVGRDVLDRIAAMCARNLAALGCDPCSKKGALEMRRRRAAAVEAQRSGAGSGDAAVSADAQEHAGRLFPSLMFLLEAAEEKHKAAVFPALSYLTFADSQP